MNLLLITDTIPYAQREYFLEKEIPILAEYLDEILLVPLFYHDLPKTEHALFLPKNVHMVLLDRPWKTRRDLLRQLSLKMLSDAHRFLEALWHGKGFSLEEIHTLLASSFIHHIYSNQLSNIIDLSKYPIWYSYWGNSTGIFFDFLRAHCLKRYPVLQICRMHGYDLYAERENKNFLPWQKRLIETCDIIYPCSKQGELYLARKYPHHQEKIQCAYLGVSPQSIINPGSSDGVLRILSCSSLIPVKRVNLIAETLALIERAVEWTHIGDGPERESIEQIASKLPNHIKYRYMGNIENRQVMDIYKTHPVDVFINVSESEGIPVSIMEAMSFGIEPIATDVGGVAELVKHEFGVLLEPDFKIDELAKILDNYRTDVRRRQKAQVFQKQYFSTENFNKFAQEIIGNVTSKHKSK